MNDTRRPWTLRTLIGLVVVVIAFGVADVAGLTPSAPIDPSAGAPSAARVVEPTQMEMAEDVQPSLLPATQHGPSLRPPTSSAPPRTEERHPARPRTKPAERRHRHARREPVVAPGQVVPPPSSAAVFDAARFATHLDEALHGMWRQWLAGSNSRGEPHSTASRRGD